MNLSIIKYYGEQNRGSCGYCKENKSSYKHGMHAYMMTTHDYQDLIDRGWRRSGEYCYKPNNSLICCPSYTIKCDSQEFKLSKSHKKILKRMNKFLRDGVREKLNVSEETGSEVKDDETALPRELVDIPDMVKQEINTDDIANICRKVNETCDIALKRFKCNKTESNVEEIEEDKKDASSSNQNHPRQCKKAKQLRLEKKKAKLEAKGLSLNLEKNNINKEKNLSDFLNDTRENDRHKLKILLVPSHKGSMSKVFKVYQKYQVTIHNDPPHKITKSQFEKFLCTTPLKVKLLEAKSRECLSNLKETYALYQKYQTIIHNDPPENLKEFLEFLQKSPLKHYKPEDGPAEGYGSFHQQYWLDDKLIAVGVIDILPYCLSSVYFFYDPDYSFLSLGTYGSLREIDLVRQLSETVPLLKYYYMGFYIHSCPKMKYKGKLPASYLLCPDKYTWHLLSDEIRAKLDINKYQVLNNDPNYKDKEEFTRDDLGEVLILFQRNSYVTYSEYKQIKKRNLDEEILEYGNLVGKSCAHRMLFLEF